MSSVLPRMEIRLPQELKERLTALATERGVSLSEIGLAALQELLDKPENPFTALLETLRRLERVERLLEGFVRVFFTLTPDPQGQSDVERQTAARRGLERWQRFQALLDREKE